jgi:hypothetical protein
MAKGKRAAKPGSSAAQDAAPARRPDESLAPSTAEAQIATSNLSLHELFQQQAREMLDRTDLDEEQKQNILVAMSCPCCGAGGMSFTAKLKRRT